MEKTFTITLTQDELNDVIFAIADSMNDYDKLNEGCEDNRFTDLGINIIKQKNATLRK